MVPKICTFPECAKPHVARGYCSAHYSQLKRGAQPRELRDPAMTAAERFNANIDKSGDCWEWTGSKTRQGYPRFGKSGYSHRISWEMANGPIPPKAEIDHICHNAGCVKPAHLRLATRKQNIENHSGPKRNCKSGVRGVYFDKRARKWVASVRHDGAIHRLGQFADLAEAGAAVTAKRNELHSYNNVDRAGMA